MNALYAALIGLGLALLEQLFFAYREQRARRQMPDFSGCRLSGQKGKS